MIYEQLKALNPSALICRQNSTHYINKEDLQIKDFVLYRTKDNLKSPIFILLLDQFNKTDDLLLQTLKQWINLKQINVDLNFHIDFKKKDFVKNKLYIFNFFQHHSITHHSPIFDNIFIANYLIENCGSMIFIINNIKQIPKSIVSASHSIFIRNNQDIKDILAYTEPMLFPTVNLLKEDNDYIVIDRLKLWSNLSILKL
jgi:hypothetical protein